MDTETRTTSTAHRAVFAAVTAATMLVTFGALGGVGLAKSTISAAQYQYGKTTICHKGKTISVGTAAVAAHERHGDTVGTCAEARAEAKAEAKAAKAEAKAKQRAAKAAAKAAKAKAKAEAAAAKAAAKAKTKSKAARPAPTDPAATAAPGARGKGKGKG
jgi:hypothetical protein